MTDINVISLTGRLARDVELRDTSNSKVALFTLAYNTYEYNSESKEKGDKSNFIDCKLWGKGAENISKYLKKGAMICISGDLHQEKWQDDKGTHTKHTITVRTINFAGNKRSSEENNTTTPTDVGNDFAEEFHGSDIPF